MNYFLGPVRHGVTDPAHVVREVVMRLKADLARRSQWRTAEALEPFRRTVLAVLSYPEEALALAAEAVVYHQLPREEIRRRKEERGRQFARASMRGKPATDRQRWKLRQFGVADAEIPGDRLAASVLIDCLSTEGRHAS